MDVAHHVEVLLFAECTTGIPPAAPNVPMAASLTSSLTASYPTQLLDPCVQVVSIFLTFKWESKTSGAPNEQCLENSLNRPENNELTQICVLLLINIFNCSNVLASQLDRFLDRFLHKVALFEGYEISIQEYRQCFTMCSYIILCILQSCYEIYMGNT